MARARLSFWPCVANRAASTQEWTASNDAGTTLGLSSPLRASSWLSLGRLRRSRRRAARERLVWFASVGVVTSSSPVAALAIEESTQLAVEGPSRLSVAMTGDSEFCGELTAVRDEATRRSPRMYFVDAGEGSNRRVTVRGLSDAQKSGVGASVHLESPKQSQHRELWAKDCGELVRAVGFVISVTFDPPSPEVTLPADPEPAPLAENPPNESRANSPNSEFEVTDIYDFKMAPIFGIEPPTRVRGGIGATSSLGVAPNPIWGGALSLQADFASDATWGALTRLELAGGTSFARDFEGGTAEFQRLSASLFVGPTLNPGGVQVAVAGFGRGGVLRALGRDTMDPRSYDRPWFDAGLALFVNVELLSDWFLEFEVAGSRALARYAFQFEPIIFHRVSPWLTHVGIHTSTTF